MTGNVYLDLTRLLVHFTMLEGETLYGPPAALQAICAVIGTHRPKAGSTSIWLAPGARQRVRTLAAWTLG